MNKIVVSGISRFPEIKKPEKLWQAVQNGEFFKFPQRDILLSWKFKHWLKEASETANDYTQLITHNVDKVFRQASWQALTKPTTEYGLILATTEGSEIAQIKFYQEVQKAEAKYFNPKLLLEIYFNKVLNDIAKHHFIRGHSLIFWHKNTSGKDLLKEAFLMLQHHNQRGCLVITAEESTQEFGASVLLLEQERFARERGLETKYYLLLDDKGKIVFGEEKSEGK